MSDPNQSGLSAPIQNFDVELPAGGKLPLQTIQEVEVFEDAREAYLRDFQISHHSDKLAIGSLLLMHLEIFRNQQRLNGMEAEVDANSVPTGRYKKVEVKGQDRASALTVLIKARESVAETEKSLGIDKRTRDQGGQYDIATYIGGAKQAAREYGVHLSKRYMAYVTFVMALRTQHRMLRQLDSEDLAEMRLTPESLLDWIWNELVKLEEVDKKFAHEKGKLIAGLVR